jgi:cellulose synthase/poly-beta-1,6-N-acetylglucosamine synthase-like glycosyltransferase
VFRGTTAKQHRPLLSVIVPTLNEQAVVGGLLADLESLTVSREVIVADGLRLRDGAAVARAPLLLFLHADARLDGEALALLVRREELVPARRWRRERPARRTVRRVHGRSGDIEEDRK